MSANFIKIENVTGATKGRVKQSLKFKTGSPLEPYAKNESYLLHVTSNVMSKKGQKLHDEIVIQFKV